MEISKIGEFELVNTIKKDFIEDLVLDDAAVVEVGDKGKLAVSVSSFIEDIHFNLDYFSFYEVGWRAVSACLADIAAMAAEPLYCLPTLSLPKKLNFNNFKEIYKGITQICSLYDVKIIGGDISSGYKINLHITMIGYWGCNKILRREGAKLEDKLALTGTIGDAHAGLRICQEKNNIKTQYSDSFEVLVKKFKLPRPRIKEAKIISNFAHAMIDISDSLSQDAIRLAKANGLGIKIYKDKIPLSLELEEFCRVIKEDEYNFALYGGEDFELLFAIPQNLIPLARERVEFTVIGEFTEEDYLLLSNDNKIDTLQPRGFEHFRS